MVEADGTTTKLNEPGPRLSPAELDALAADLVRRRGPASWAVLSGSLSPGAPAGWYAEIIGRLRGSGRGSRSTAPGAPLARAIAAHPDLVKPNREEPARNSPGRPIETIADVVGAAQRLAGDGVRTVLTSLGPAGAVLVRGDSAWHATAAAVEPRSTSAPATRCWPATWPRWRAAPAALTRSPKRWPGAARRQPCPARACRVPPHSARRSPPLPTRLPSWTSLRRVLGFMKLVAVTSCPTGIAHTSMPSFGFAAEILMAEAMMADDPALATKVRDWLRTPRGP